MDKINCATVVLSECISEVHPLEFLILLVRRIITYFRCAWLIYLLRHLDLSAEKARYAARDPIVALKKYILEKNLAREDELKTIDKKIDEIIDDSVEFADASPPPPRSQLLENVFADPKGFGIGPDGRYCCEDPKFTAGTAQV